MKMGFKGRLGKKKDGVTRQQEVKLRPMQSGIVFGYFKEATTLKVNREIEADRHGKTLEKVEAEMGLSAAFNKARGRGAAKSKEEEMADKRLRKPLASREKGTSPRRRERRYTRGSPRR